MQIAALIHCSEKHPGTATVPILPPHICRRSKQEICSSVSLSVPELGLKQCLLVINGKPKQIWTSLLSLVGIQEPLPMFAKESVCHVMSGSLFVWGLAWVCIKVVCTALDVEPYTALWSLQQPLHLSSFTLGWLRLLKLLRFFSSRLRINASDKPAFSSFKLFILPKLTAISLTQCDTLNLGVQISVLSIGKWTSQRLTNDYPLFVRKEDLKCWNGLQDWAAQVNCGWEELCL